MGRTLRGIAVGIALYLHRDAFRRVRIMSMIQLCSHDMALPEPYEEFCLPFGDADVPRDLQWNDSLRGLRMLYRAVWSAIHSFESVNHSK